ncbi:SDR family oxidoreductase [Flavobacterium psychrotolerans]|uniref:Short-chain dehydrogenase/reductase n=1 Tax=Flavobacterium psychrotolerans TaxID=2169410 RepID=A0A2U1JLW7_9FLAO|nr:SDR family oxidoreductase [Flavobacterium psychrotolerans]PWA05873.1 short-chain dehydrogenase/reductase [Flavobacterium psychrotolerans]
MSKTIFITGTNSGFGKAMVELFASNGWNVAATVRNKSQHPDLFKELANVKLYDLEVTNYQQVEDVAKTVISDFKKIDAVVNNAGYCLMGPTETTTMEQIEDQYKTNVFGLMAVTKAFIPHFRENKNGIFINFASASAKFNYPFIATYGSSKWAVRGISESLGIELSPFGIEVKTIYPGAHATKIFTKLDQGTSADNPIYTKNYKEYYTNFLLGFTAVQNVTSPNSIAQEVYKAVTNPKGGKLHIVSGRDAKFLDFLKKMLSQRAFQKQQANAILKPMSASSARFFQWIFGSNVEKLHTDVPQNLTK